MKKKNAPNDERKERKEVSNFESLCVSDVLCEVSWPNVFGCKAIAIAIAIAKWHGIEVVGSLKWNFME